MTRRDRLRKTMRNVVTDAVSDIFYYDRKEDEDMDREAVDEMFRKGWVTPAEIVSWFEQAVEEAGMPAADTSRTTEEG